MRRIQRIVFLDTETTGLPKERWLSALQKPNNWPDIVSVAWSVYNNQGQPEHEEYHIIQPESWEIPEESTKIHGITKDIALARGELLSETLLTLAEHLKAADLVVAHNLEFDRNVLFNAYKWRMDTEPTQFWPTSEFCSMTAAEPELKIPFSTLKLPYKSSRKYKSPKLDELYLATFNSLPQKAAHNSQRDVQVLAEIYWKRWSHLIL